MAKKNRATKVKYFENEAGSRYFAKGDALVAVVDGKIGLSLNIHVIDRRRLICRPEEAEEAISRLLK